MLSYSKTFIEVTKKKRKEKKQTAARNNTKFITNLIEK
jgi:hypothetical protein